MNGKAIQYQNLHVTNSANQRCSWQYIRSRQNWQDSLGWVIYKNFKLCSYSLTQPLTGSGLYIIKIIKIKGWFFCYKIDPKMFWIAQMGDQSTPKIVRHKMPSSATILARQRKDLVSPFLQTFRKFKKMFFTVIKFLDGAGTNMLLLIEYLKRVKIIATICSPVRPR